MPRGQKTCPKCSNACGPRTKVCSCGHIYLISTSKKEVVYEDGVIKQGKGKCSNCSIEYESEDFTTDNYGTITYVFRFGNYCSYSCVADASSKKDSLILDILEKLEERNDQEMNLFIEEKEETSEFGPLIQDIFQRADSLKEEEEYRKTHPMIILTSNPRKKQSATSPEECEENGIKTPPKVGEYISVEPEIEINSIAKFLKTKQLDSVIEDSEELGDSEENSDEEEIIDNVTASPLGDGRALTFAEKINQTFKQKLSETIVNSSSSNYDSISKPTQGQKKCGAKDRAKGLTVGCGKILGVRVKQCLCGYVFP